MNTMKPPTCLLTCCSPHSSFSELPGMRIPKSAVFLCLSGVLTLVVSDENVSPFSCQPGQPCWPSLSEWAAFNKTVSGRLRITAMLSSPVFPAHPTLMKQRAPW